MRSRELGPAGIDSMQLMLGYCLCQPSGYGGLVIVIIEVVQVIRILRSDTTDDFSERIAFDSVNFAVRILPKSFYRSHNVSPP